MKLSGATCTGTQLILAQQRFPEMGVAIGQRFRDLSPGVFAPSPREMIIRAIDTATDGREHAILALATDNTTTKTIAVAVSEDRQRYVVIASG